LVLNENDHTFKNEVSIKFILIGVNINEIITNTTLENLEDDDVNQLFEQIMNANESIKNLSTIQYMQENSTHNMINDPLDKTAGNVEISMNNDNQYKWTGTTENIRYR
jgi:hypothetical protein